MRTLYIVAYDISNPKRLRQTFKLMRGFGDHLQLSVFRCELSEMERVQMIAELGQVIHHRDDQILIAPLGPPTGHNARSIATLGRALTHSRHHVIVV